MLLPGRNWNYFEAGCRDYAVQHRLDLVVYTGDSPRVIVS